MSLTPDGVRYLAIADGKRVPRPFHYRWFVPWVCKKDGRRWVSAQVLSLALCGVSVSALAGWGSRGWFCAGLMLGLPGIARFNLSHPVLVDLPAMSLALLAASVVSTSLPLAIAIVCISGTTKESAPCFAAAWAWNPWLLLGLFAPLTRNFLRAGRDPITHGPAHDALLHPIRTARAAHKDLPLAAWILPWGVLLLGLHSMSLQLAVVLSIALAQCLLATDTVRLYQWAWPTLAIATASVIPLSWMVPALLVHWANPFAGDGL